MQGKESKERKKPEKYSRNTKLKHEIKKKKKITKMCNTMK